MKEENNSENTKIDIENKKEETKKISFWKSLWYSITKIENYPEMAATGLGRAMSYMSKIVAILAIVLSLGMIYKTTTVVKNGVNYLQNEFPEFTYQDGKLDVETTKKIEISEEDSIAGKVIIDTKTENEQEINSYLNEITKQGEGIIILKDKVMIKTPNVSGTISYKYKDSLDNMGITNFTKQDVINYANSSQIISLYVSLGITIFIYAFIMYLLTTISNTVLLSIFGYITTWLARIKMRYVAIFNMSVYALTLSTILNMLYIAVNIFIPFTMEYFQVMYVAVAAIYLVAAILILKTEFIKKQFELMKIAEAEKIIKKELQEKEREEQEQQEKEDRKKKDKEEEKKKKENKKEEKGNNEPEGEGCA